MHDSWLEDYDHHDRPQKRVPIDERLRFPQEQSAKQGCTEELDETAYRREFILEFVSQWCPGGLTRSQNRRVQRSRQNEQVEMEAEAAKIWHPKKKADKPGTSININLVFFLPVEYRS
jgi:hypothetical protein